ncbi:hypothetical protein WJX74_000347 [Apatococcus lobatus]|uniref:Dynein heavy chain tail domain-containing protein n=1 Tax=Apatococcus lobatus TaxID=904363 RepID=A0AAW1QN83_9CHLO
MGDKDAETKPADRRYLWLGERICSSLKVKDDSYQKLLASENRQEPDFHFCGSASDARRPTQPLVGSCRASLAQFLDSANVTTLLVYVDGKDLGAAARSVPKKVKKSVYFVKLTKAALSNDTVSKQVVCGELGESVLEQLSSLSQEVVLPLLSNPANHVGISDGVGREVQDRLHQFIADACVAIGQTKGQTLLPLPATNEEADRKMAGNTAAVPGLNKNKDALHLLENAVVTWTRQIKGALKATPQSAAAESGVRLGPLQELQFWQERAQDLNSVSAQLTNAKTAKLIKLLEVSQSTYYPGFVRHVSAFIIQLLLDDLLLREHRPLAKEVETGRAEANDNVRYLAPLRKLLEKLSQLDDFQALPEVFKPLMHTLLLIWKHSQFYNTAARMACMLSEICDELIAQASRFLPGAELVQMEPQEAVDKLRTTLKVLGSFKQLFGEYSAKSRTEPPGNPWTFQTSSIFARLDSYQERCSRLMEMSQASLQFSRLERVEIGGTKGKALTANVKQVHTEYMAAAGKLQKVTYDVTDTDQPMFQQDFADYQAVVAELEHRLGSIIFQAVDDCTTVAAIFKLLEGFEGLLEREAIAGELERKYLELLAAFSVDIRQVTEMLQKNQRQPPLSRNAAPHSGAVAWVRSLKERASAPMEKLKGLQKVVLESDEAREVMRAYDRLAADIEAYERSRVEDWGQLVSEISEQKLKQPLLRSEQVNGLTLLQVNFDPSLVKLLREVHYFLLLPGLKQSIPASALKVYERADSFRAQIGNLELIVGLYNDIQRTMMPVEKPLIQGKLDTVDAALRKGLQLLNWNSLRIDDQILEVMALVRDVNETLSAIKATVSSTQKILADWLATPMFERKEGKSYSYDDLSSSANDLIRARHLAVSDGSKDIGKLLSATNRTLKVSKSALAWRAYVDFIQELVIEGLASSIIKTLEHLTNQACLRGPTSPSPRHA